jgi:hypothetical protein
MALTVTNVLGVPYRRVGNQRKVVKKVVCDNSYLEGGEPLTRSELGLNVLEDVSVEILSGSENEAEFPVSSGWYTISDEKLHLLNAKTSKEVASTKNVEKVVAKVTAFGW